MENDHYLPELSERMLAAAQLVTAGNRLADIGCDHGYISIYLYRTGRCPKCIAADVNAGPLEGAKRNTELFDAAAGVETRLSDGLKAIEPGEADTILITGMGGNLMERILEEGREVVLSAKEIIAEPQSDPQKVRKCICSMGFSIVCEDFVAECGKYYPVIRAIRSETGQILSEAEAVYGPCLMRSGGTLYRSWLEKEKLRLSSILDELTKKKAAPERQEELKRELELLKEAFSEGK